MYESKWVNLSSKDTRVDIDCKLIRSVGSMSNRCITQLVRMSFQTSIAHKPGQVRCREVHASVVTEWPSACLHMLLPREQQTATKGNINWKKFLTKWIFVLQNPFKFWIYMDVFKDFVPVLGMTLLTKIKKITVGTGAPYQRLEVYQG